MSESNLPTRPGVITLVSILVGIQALSAAIVSATTFTSRNDSAFQEVVGRSADQLLVKGIIEAVLAVVLVLVAFGVLRGSSGARTFVAAAMALRIGVGVWTMISHSGGYVASAAVTLAISLFVLWALYDHREASAFFA
jgi:hypothetical protein